MTPDPGIVDKMRCTICNSKCPVERSRYGTTGFASTMARKQTHHDFFYCPHDEEEWHAKALQLFRALEDMPSRRVVEPMQKDLEDILEKELSK